MAEWKSFVETRCGIPLLNRSIHYSLPQSHLYQTNILVLFKTVYKNTYPVDDLQISFEDYLIIPGGY
jgi:hypothetical protein